MELCSCVAVRRRLNHLLAVVVVCKSYASRVAEQSGLTATADRRVCTGTGRGCRFRARGTQSCGQPNHGAGTRASRNRTAAQQAGGVPGCCPAALAVAALRGQALQPHFRQAPAPSAPACSGAGVEGRQGSHAGREAMRFPGSSACGCTIAGPSRGHLQWSESERQETHQRFSCG